MSLKKLFLVSLISATALSSVANAEGYYVQANGGVSVSTDAGNDVNKKMGNSGIYGLEVGAKVYDSLRVGLSVDYRPNYSAKQTENYTYNFVPKDPKSNPAKGLDMEHSYHYKVKSLVAMANLYYDVTDFNGVTPYVNLGLGMAQNKAKLDMDQYTTDSTASKEMKEVTHFNYSKTKTNFAYKLGLGARYAVNDQFDVDVRYQYVDLGKFEVTGVTPKVGATGTVDKKGKLRSHEFLLGVAFKF
jgi:opacity protein-like surface antigen